MLSLPRAATCATWTGLGTLDAPTTVSTTANIKALKMKKTILSLILLWCGMATAGAQPAAEGNDSVLLAARLDSLIEHILPASSDAGVCIYDLTARKPIYSYQAGRLSRPASTMKLLTAITALSHPRANEPFRTEVWYQGTVKADTLHGDLYVVGGFDPEFDEKALDSLVCAVARQPFSVITGKVYGDVSMKDSLYWGKGWLWDDNPSAYQPYLSPLMLNKGVVTISASPAERGMPALLKCKPESSYYRLVNHTKSHTPAAGGFRITRDWMQNSNELVATGNVNQRTARILNLYSSENFFMHTFVERLAKSGVEADACYGFRDFHADDLSQRIAAYETPMQTVLNECLKESDNLNAEALLFRLGKQTKGKPHASAKDCLDIVKRLITQLGFDPDDYSVADGCGLSHYNYVSAELLVAFLRYAYSQTAVFQSLYRALPTSGTDGTLKHRMGKGTPAYRRVHAKTGSFTAISCLAGYLQADNGHWVAFAIMNQNILSGWRARKFQDEVCTHVITMLP